MKDSSVAAVPQGGQAASETPSASPLSARKFLLKTWWVWAAATVIVAGCAAFWIFYLRPSSAPASASILVDDFTRDQSLPTGLWTINGPIGNAVAPDITSPASTLVQPTLTFSSQSGLGIGGVSERGKIATIEANASFDIPFTVNANVMPGPRDGSSFGLIVSDGSGLKGVGIVGHSDSAAGPTEIDYIAPEAGAGWKSQGVLCSSPQANMWFTLSIVLDGKDGAFLKVQSQGETVGQGTVKVATGRFYIVLLQKEDRESASSQSQGHTYWRSIQVLSGSGLQQAAGHLAAQNSRAQETPGFSAAKAVTAPGPTASQSSLPPGQTAPIQARPPYAFNGAQAQYEFRYGWHSSPVTVSIRVYSIPLGSRCAVAIVFKGLLAPLSRNDDLYCQFSQHPFWASPSDLAKLRNNWIPPNWPGGGSGVRHDVATSVPAGRFFTEEIYSPMGSAWYDSRSGLLLKAEGNLLKGTDQQIPALKGITQSSIVLSETNIRLTPAPFDLFSYVWIVVFIVLAGLIAYWLVRTVMHRASRSASRS